MDSEKKTNHKFHTILFALILCLGLFLRILNLMENSLTGYLHLIYSTIAIVAVFFTMKRISGIETGLWAMLLLSVCPWHIFLSSWTRTENILPQLLILALCFFTYGLGVQKLLILSGLLYGISFLFAPKSFLLILFILLTEWGFGFLTKGLKKSKEFILHATLSLGIPLVFLAYSALTGNVSFHFTFHNPWTNLTGMLHLVFNSKDAFSFEALEPFGYFGIAAGYVVFLGVVLLALTLFYGFSLNKKPLSWLIMLELFSVLIFSLIVPVDIVLLNALFIPLVLCGSLGITTITGLLKGFHWKKISTVVLILFFLFEAFQFHKITSKEAYREQYKNIIETENAA